MSQTFISTVTVKVHNMIEFVGAESLAVAQWAMAHNLENRRVDMSTVEIVNLDLMRDSESETGLYMSFTIAGDIA